MSELRSLQNKPALHDVSVNESRLVPCSYFPNQMSRNAWLWDTGALADTHLKIVAWSGTPKVHRAGVAAWRGLVGFVLRAKRAPVPARPSICFPALIITDQACHMLSLVTHGVQGGASAKQIAEQAKSAQAEDFKLHGVVSSM